MSLETIRPKPDRILDFDVECRPLSWINADYVSREITAIAWSWVGEKKVHVVLLGELTLEQMLSRFHEAYSEATLVTGHYIRGFDLPLLNWQALELGLPAFEAKMTQDTKQDLVLFSGGSKSQEALGAMLGLEHPKVQMTQADWRSANRLERRGLDKVRNRVRGDVLQHKEMREILIARKALGRGRVWDPKGHGIPSYQP